MDIWCPALWIRRNRMAYFTMIARKERNRGDSSLACISRIIIRELWKNELAGTCWTLKSRQRKHRHPSLCRIIGLLINFRIHLYIRRMRPRTCLNNCKYRKDQGLIVCKIRNTYVSCKFIVLQVCKSKVVDSCFIK